ncbi:hypothetical protein WS67_12045 [Burkholderia singularis]|uniref:Uncharacterized protein n=1 Tax=Burkholderia singularis TaxID=1503053 RepID=A0A103E2P6_9BURK|nr:MULTISPECIES: hypothetical protein [Burkholderia]KVE27228.1 hypothetical protein WS67_12045 [Burkholderia singularis]KVE33722.1 hypothetical protein WS68_11140 [Burkholderia sp. TSV86]
MTKTFPERVAETLRAIGLPSILISGEKQIGALRELLREADAPPAAAPTSIVNETGAEGALIERLRLLMSGDSALCRSEFARNTIEQAIGALSRSAAPATAPTDEPYRVTIDVRDLFAYLRAAWREGQHYDREDFPDQVDSWSAASDYANKTIERWTSMQPAMAIAASADQIAHDRKMVASVDERAAFERWYTRGTMRPIADHDRDAVTAWDAWQARAAASPAAEAAAEYDWKPSYLQLEKDCAELKRLLNARAPVAESLLREALYLLDNKPDGPTDHARRDEFKALVRAYLAAPQPAQADAPAETHQCCNSECAWKGDASATMTMKHGFPNALCPRCNEVTEPVAPADAPAEPFPYQKTFNAIAAATTVEGGNVAISVKAFRDAFGDAPAEALEPHSDDVAVDSFAAVMKHKLALARDKGRGGWETCSPADLSRMLLEHVDKGDPRDVANLCMMLWHHGSPIVSAPADAGEARLTDEQRAMLMQAADFLELTHSRLAAVALRALLNGADHDR